MTGLSHNSVHRLTELFESLPSSVTATYEYLCNLVHYSNNYRWASHLQCSVWTCLICFSFIPWFVFAICFVLFLFPSERIDRLSKKLHHTDIHWFRILEWCFEILWQLKKVDHFPWMLRWVCVWCTDFVYFFIFFFLELVCSSLSMIRSPPNDVWSISKKHCKFSDWWLKHSPFSTVVLINLLQILLFNWGLFVHVWLLLACCLPLPFSLADRKQSHSSMHNNNNRLLAGILQANDEDELIERSYQIKPRNFRPRNNSNWVVGLINWWIQVMCADIGVCEWLIVCRWSNLNDLFCLWCCNRDCFGNVIVGLCKRVCVVLMSVLSSFVWCCVYCHCNWIVMLCVINQAITIKCIVVIFGVFDLFICWSWYRHIHIHTYIHTTKDNIISNHQFKSS